MKKLLLVLLLGSTASACAPSTIPYAPYGAAYSRHHVVYVDGYSYVDRGVAHGPPPADTIIPQDDPEVGQLQPAEPEPWDLPAAPAGSAQPR